MKMDNFTERILERARERQKKLLEYSTGESVAPLKENNDMKGGSEPSIPAVTETPANAKRKVAASDSALCSKSAALTGTASAENVRIEVELQEESDSDGEEKENHSSIKQKEQPIIREDAKKRLQRLGKLYAEGDDVDISSPIHRTEPTFSVETSPRKNKKCDSAQNGEADKNVSKGRKGLGGLAALAQNINQWEDNLPVLKHESSDTKTPTSRKWKPPAPRPPITSARSTEATVSKSSPSRSTKSPAPKPPAERESSKATTPTKAKSADSAGENTAKQLNLDPSLVETLESQGFTRTHSNSRLVYNYNPHEHNIKKAEITIPAKLSQNDCIAEESESEEFEPLISRTTSVVTHTNRVIESKLSPQKTVSPVKSSIKGPNVANRAAMFELASSPTKTNSSKDPALLSVSERKALFEKNKGAAPVPKAPISMAAPTKSKSPIKTSVASVEKIVATSLSPKKEKSEGANKAPIKYPAPRPPIRPDDKTNSAFRVAPGESGGIASKMAALFQNKTTISQQQIENSIREQRQKEMDILLNRFQKNKEINQNKNDLECEVESPSDNEDGTETTAMITEKSPQIILTSCDNIPLPPPPPLGPSGNKRRSGGKRCSKEDSPKVAAVLDDVKRIKVTSSKPGRLYPCLSDIETATETETEYNAASPTPNNSSYEDNCSESDVDVAETSFGREVLQTVCKNQSSNKQTIYNESTESDMSDILDGMDDYLDEAMAYDASKEDGPTPPKQSRSKSPESNVAEPSSSFQYKNYSPQKRSPQKKKSPAKDFKTPSFSPRKSEDLPSYIVDGDNVLPLTHTVSFYRRQQAQESKTPIRQIIRHPIIEESPDSSSLPSDKQNDEVQSKIQELLEEMTKQQTIISQTSQALNLCCSTPEFIGSTEQVEAEKVLLLATHRRAAAQREMERLSVLKTLHPENNVAENIPLEKGRITIRNVVLPLKREYVRALNATGGKGHHVVCLVKCAEQVQATQLVSTVATNDKNPNLELSIPGEIHLNNIYSNFTAQLEVYCLQAQEEILPHEVKYHINSKKPSNKLTPKKSKPESRLIRPPKESPGGPQAVRSPTFALMGYVVFSIQGINRKNWTLNNTPSMSPLEGIVEMRIKCELQLSVEHRGFLTMFEDISGFGAWHRRWCLLKDSILSYWKYPEEEKKKAPIDSIDLRSCITQQVGPVRRDICARLHTILIETSRPARAHDVNSLVMECNGDVTIIRHLLSADTKEEKIEWCCMFNKALAAMRMNGNLK